MPLLNFFKKVFKRDADEDESGDIFIDLPEDETPAKTDTGDENSGPPEEDDISEDMLESLDEMFRSMEQDEVLKQTQAVISFVRNDDEAKLQDLIEQSKVDSSTLELDSNFVNEASMYDEEKGIVKIEEVERKERIKPELIEEEQQNLLSLILGIPASHPYITIGSMAACIVLLIIFAVVFTIHVDKSTTEAALEKNRIRLVQPVNASNDSNYIYIYHRALFEDGSVVLEKMTIDRLATVFYFSDAIDPANYYITIDDDNGRIYLMQHHVQNLLMNESSTTIWFPPLEPDVETFTMSFYNKALDETVTFYFALSEPVSFPAARFFNTASVMSVDSSGLSLVLEDAHFSSAGSTINYRLSWKNESERFIQLNNKNSSSIELQSSGQRILQTDRQPVETIFTGDKSLLGRMDFGPVKNLDSPLRITFRNLYKSYDTNRLIETVDLFTNQPENEKRLRIGGYTLVLERIGWQGNYLVLVLHAEEGSGKTAQTDMDVDLLIDSESGPISLKGECHSGPIGTDILFDTGEYEDLAYKTSVSDITLRINSVLVKVPDVSMAIEPLNTAISPQRQDFTASVTEAFEKRLSYKSGELQRTDLTGFSSELKNNEGLMGFYTPSPGQGFNDTEYSAHIVTYSMQYDYSLAYVHESWRATDADGEITAEFQRTHHIKVIMKNDEWIIVSDTVES